MNHTQSSGTAKPTTTAAGHSPRLLAIGVIGAAMVDHQVHRSASTRARLEGAADMAQRLGVLDGTEAQLIATLLARYDSGQTYNAFAPGVQA
ncbi:hypothetical protein [Pseudomonas monteilii]|uniref:hypothetical protein n=1 Tax=Pseudomonas monteilii TaxID=76759 RepID=UPI0018A3560A|nr:hypothetical protein [Pseudomonas monteilii]BBV94886.1 hypothetical protein STW0522PSE72_02370 [Pseudomonas monteilii]